MGWLKLAALPRYSHSLKCQMAFAKAESWCWPDKSNGTRNFGSVGIIHRVGTIYVLLALYNAQSWLCFSLFIFTICTDAPCTVLSEWQWASWFTSTAFDKNITRRPFWFHADCAAIPLLMSHSTLVALNISKDLSGHSIFHSSCFFEMDPVL